MKKILPIIAILTMLLSGCGTDRPEITSINNFDRTPVTGQRILLQAYGISDNYPMYYVWQASGGTLEDGGLLQNWAYWTAPDAPGDYQVICTLLDDEKETETITFLVTVAARSVKTLLDGSAASAQVACLSKQTAARTGGIWAAIQDGHVWNYTPTAARDTGWGDNFTALAARRTSSYYYAYDSIWGAILPAADWKIYKYENTTASSFDCESTCTTVNDMLLDGNALWVGAASGIHLYDVYYGSWNSDVHAQLTDQVNDLAYTADSDYAAATTGIWEWDKTAESPVWSQIQTADCRAVAGDASGNIYFVADDGGTLKVYQNSTATVIATAGTEIPTVAESLDIDLGGNLWCGKYRWDGTVWDEPTGIADTVTESLVGPDNLVYFRTDTDKLLVWGK